MRKTAKSNLLNELMTDTNIPDHLLDHKSPQLGTCPVDTEERK